MGYVEKRDEALIRDIMTALQTGFQYSENVPKDAAERIALVRSAGRAAGRRLGRKIVTHVSRFETPHSPGHVNVVVVLNDELTAEEQARADAMTRRALNEAFGDMFRKDKDD